MSTILCGVIFIVVYVSTFELHKNNTIKNCKELPGLHLSSLHIPHGLWTPLANDLYTKMYCQHYVQHNIIHVHNKGKDFVKYH